MKTKITVVLILTLFLSFSAFAEAIPKFTIGEVNQKLFDLEGQIFIIEFNRRSEIKQIAKEVYETTLWGRSAYIDVCFNRNAFDYMEKKISQRFGKKQPLYATIKNSKLVLLGCVAHKDMYGNISFKW